MHNHTSRYSDYVRTPSGLQYQDLRPGTGKDAREGAQVTVDWDGYTIGYYGRPFEARNKVAAPLSGPLQPCLGAAVLAASGKTTMTREQKSGSYEPGLLLSRWADATLRWSTIVKHIVEHML